MRSLNVLITVMLLILTSALYSQSVVSFEEPAITSLMDRYKAQNAQVTYIKGFRIQVASTTDRAKIQQQAGSFGYHFPEMKADWINEKPYYKLRTGAYGNKLSCMYMLKQIQEHFPGAYMIVDNQIPIAEVRNM